MNFSEAKCEVMKLLSKVKPSELNTVLRWLRTSDKLDEFLSNNNKVILQNISEELRASLPPDAMFPSESTAYTKMQQCSQPTVHVDSFLYDEDQVDSLCEEGTMSRSYCLTCGSYRTAPLDFISHSFSISELQFLFENVLPDLSGRVLVDVGSRLGAVLYGGYVFSSASHLIGLEIKDLTGTLKFPSSVRVREVDENLVNKPPVKQLSASARDFFFLTLDRGLSLHLYTTR
ncbi:hypothetical protein ABVT39_023934 [Epinephelus coioides]